MFWSLRQINVLRGNLIRIYLLPKKNTQINLYSLKRQSASIIPPHACSKNKIQLIKKSLVS